MKVKIHRGAAEIGGTCVEVESAGRRILIDAGMPLAATKDVSSMLPLVNSASLSAIIISHPHLDHYGLLPWLAPVPVAMGAAARRILRAAAPFMRHRTPDMDGPDLANWKPVGIGSFRITPYLVDHSAYDAYALLVEADGKRLFYSGDFRAHGRKHQLFDRLVSNPPTNIDALLLEGTTLGRMGERDEPTTEEELKTQFVNCFQAAKGLALVHASAQNIDRIVTLYRASHKSGRTLVIDLYTALILEATLNPKIPQSQWNDVALCIPQRQRIQIKRNAWFEALNRHSRNRIYLGRQIAKQPDKYVLLFRPLWMPDLEQAHVLDGATFVHSQWEGYLREPACQSIDEWRLRHGLPLHQIHTSGHASPADLRLFANALAPKALVPIHSAAPESYASIYPHVARHVDGEWWEV